MMGYRAANPMTPRDFIAQVVHLYQEARRPLYPHPRISRGVSRAIASQAEDLLAFYLIDQLAPDTTILVNQTITPATGQPRQRIKPDLAIVKEGAIKAIVDLKMDLGWMRKEFLGYWREWEQRIPQLRSREFRLHRKDGASNARESLTFSSQARLFFVLVSDTNMKQAQLREIEAKRRKKSEYSNLLILSSRMHPNDPSTFGMSVEEVLDRIRINDKEFERWVDAVRGASLGQ